MFDERHVGNRGSHVRPGEDRIGDGSLIDHVHTVLIERVQKPDSGSHTACIGTSGRTISSGGSPLAAPAFALGSLGAMRIARALYDEMVQHALRDAPDECCGMVASRDGEAVRIYPAENSAHSPLRYEIDGAEQYRIQMAIDDEDLDLGAIYHSHTRSPPYPSQTDVNLAFYPEALYIIVGTAGEAPEVRAYTIRGGEIAETELAIV
jgi:proteasome lid subunit RPN8/RPN11